MWQVGSVVPGQNGWANMMAQSSEDTDKLIKMFELAIENGYNPNDVRDEIFSKLRISESQLTEFDKRRLKQRVEAAYKSRQSQ